MFTHPIFIASDHAGLELKSTIAQALGKEGVSVNDLGPYSADSVDYPDYANLLAEAMKKQGEDAMGILICGSGVGISIAANRHSHIRAALCHNTEIAALSRQHNNANVLVLGARMTSEEEALEIVRVFFATEFEGGRHALRVEKLS